MEMRRRVGSTWVQLGALVAAAVLVVGPTPEVVTRWEGATVHPRWTPALLALAAGCVLVAAGADRAGRLREVALGALVVPAAQLTGLGVWAAWRWHVAVDAGRLDVAPSRLPQLQLCAVLLAAAGLCLLTSALAALAALAATHRAPRSGRGAAAAPRSVRWARRLVGVAVLAAPVVLLLGGLDAVRPAALVQVLAVVVLAGQPWGGALLLVAGRGDCVPVGVLLSVLVLSVCWVLAPVPGLAVGLGTVLAAGAPPVAVVSALLPPVACLALLGVGLLPTVLRTRGRAVTA
ncbi:hypothetical protein [Nocardioides sp. GY 10127]|uniref:hypothetical protein n=1 Tax=Nocardioides sp. GY 10127 TaxID=2569762 RepID=UPI0010A7FBCA|nr:hypothetical protein [Nocardioides sp. GY 10127]TIC80018.1 hypothetical protein E8D37_15405 [Nocardioides sp. GY 10127]